MNQGNFQFTHAAARAVVGAAIVAMIAFAAAPVMAAKGADVDRVEARITDMHAKLKITAAQEDQWAKVAEVMRDNGKKMDELTDARQANTKTMNAVDDLKSYGEITDAHADGIKKFTPVFATLYASMSDAQKAEADELFRHAGQHKGHDKAKQKK
jgi:periplasmic protein CpxP/Spy